MTVGSERRRIRLRSPAARRAALAPVAAAAGLTAAAVAGASWSVDVLVAWDAAAVVYLALVWHAIAAQDGAGTARLAQDEEGSRRASEAVLVAAAAASLVAVAFTLGEAGRANMADASR